ncbi:glutathione S-transferase protein-like protein [Elsinoe ampelina]|uniref:Glutathione S-transferase protein-like protein n=1 Tax=Elsinoe ampelina TaxID=302913 RepID=A0A6A6GKH3_9PEZI|nr:glutathione S-transferase protein-like protein [Elsinoe ampelina]
MSEPEAKRQKTAPEYELLYHPGIPGRGEYIRLALEAAGIPYSDIANEDKSNYKVVQAICISDSTGDEDGNPPPFAPPALKIPGAGKDGKALIISQTPNILLYLGRKLGLAGTADHEQYYVNQLTLTALDLSNETHDVHHPIAVSKYYEDQKQAALTRAADFRNNRLPKFFSHFEKTLKWNQAEGNGKYLVGSKLSYADTTLWQVLDGLMFAFPKEVKARSKDYPLLFDTFYPGLKSEKWLQEYLDSERRLAYSNGIFRDYPELDRR